MDAGVAALAAAGATTLVNAMTTDAWSQVRDAFGRLWRGKAAEPSEDDLEQARSYLTSLSESGLANQVLTEQFRLRLEQLLAQDESSREAVSRFITEYGQSGVNSAGTVGSMKFTASAKDEARIYQQGQGIQKNG